MDEDKINEALLTDDFTPLLRALEKEKEQEPKDSNEAG